jgi:hypothetical protein
VLIVQALCDLDIVSHPRVTFQEIGLWWGLRMCLDQVECEGGEQHGSTCWAGSTFTRTQILTVCSCPLAVILHLAGAARSVIAFFAHCHVP